MTCDEAMALVAEMAAFHKDLGVHQYAPKPRRKHIALAEAMDIALADMTRMSSVPSPGDRAARTYAAMLAAAPTLTDADYERMARAHYEVERETRTDAPPFTRWSTWEEACELPGWKDRKIAAQRAALAALGAGG